MKMFLRFLSVLLCALVVPSQGADPQPSNNANLPPLIKSMPDYCQVDSRYGRLPGGGAQYCAPVAVSNILIWLDQHGFPDIVPGADNSCRSQYRLIKLLGSDNYMKTDKNTGTSPLDTMMGLEQYARNRGYDIEIEWKGWRDGGKFSSDKPIPTLEWLAAGTRGLSNMIVSVGWYTYNERKKIFDRLGGHYVTVVGFNPAAKNGPTLYVHNPSFGAGPARNAKPEVCRLVPITEGSFGAWCQYNPRPAKGYYRLRGIRMRNDADYAILDGAIRFELSRRTDPARPGNNVGDMTPVTLNSKDDM